MSFSMASTASASSPVSAINQSATIYFFYKSGCPHCAIVEPLVESLAAKYPQVNFVWLEIGYNSANRAQWLDLNSRYNVTTPVVPEVFIGGQVLVAENAIQTNLEPMIQNLINGNTVNSPSNTEPVGVNGSTSTNPTNEAVEAKTTSKAPAQGTNHSNATRPLNNNSNSIKRIEGAKPSSEASILENAVTQVNFTTPDGALFNSSQVTIQWNYSSGQSEVTAANVSIDNESFNPIDRNATSFVASELAEGNHSFVLRIRDKSNQSLEHRFNFTVDLNSQKMVSQTSSTSLFSGPLLIGLAVFIIFVGLVGLSLVLVQRKRKK